jgi:hypothetical protein
MNNMKSKFLLILAAGFFTVCSSCEKNRDSISPSGKITWESRSAERYDGIDASTTFKVFVTFSKTEESIEIRANENLHRYIEVKEQGGNLVIKLEDGVNVSGGNLVLEAYITTSDLSDFSVSEASSIFLQNELNSNEVSIDLSEACFFSGEINTTDLYCNLSGASGIELSGSATRLNLDVSDASTFKDYALAVDVLNADISGASNVFITVYETYTVSASGASNLYYKGNGQNENSDTSGASNIIKVE